MFKTIVFRLLVWVGMGALDDVSGEVLTEHRALAFRTDFIEWLKARGVKAEKTKGQVDDRFWRFWRLFMDSDRLLAAQIAANATRNHP